jgi:tetratricopeptide (TPR) repeat protein
MSAALLIWVLGRCRLDPTPSGFFILLLGVLVGKISWSGRWAALPGLAALIAAGTGILQAEQALAWGSDAGLLVFGLAGLGAGWLGASGKGIVLVAGLLYLLPLLPSSVWKGRLEALAGWAAVGAENPGELREVMAVRQSPIVLARLGPYGAVALREGGAVEQEGTPLNPFGRKGRAERLAGVLAGCSVAALGEKPEHVLVTGDTLGLAALSLKAQGFGLIDSVVPERALAAAQAQRIPALQKLFLHPTVRLIEKSTLLAQRHWEEIQTSVEILRYPWADGVSPWPGVGASRVRVVLLHLQQARLEDIQRIANASGNFAASLWLPPLGIDSVLLVVGPKAFSSKALQHCMEAGEEELRAWGLKNPLDLAALALSSSPEASGLSLPGLTLPAPRPPELLLTSMASSKVSDGFFPDLDPAALQARAANRALFLSLLSDSSKGDIQEALRKAQLLSNEPGGDQALGPLIAPYLAKARGALRNGQLQEASEALSTAQALFPGNADVWCLQGSLELARNESKDASKAAQSAFLSCLERDPRARLALDGLAQVARLQGNQGELEKWLRLSLSAYPDRWESAQNLGWFLFEQGRLEEAERMLKQAASTSARTENPSPLPDLALAHFYLATRSWPLALVQAERALSRKPSVEALFLKGAAHFELNQLDAATQAFEKALELDPDYYLARGGIGQVQLARKQYELAARSFEAVLERDPQNRAAKENLLRLKPLLKR